jgi:hypothetical protein
MGRIALAAVVVALAGCWPQPGQGPDRSGFNPAETALTPATVAGLVPRWSVPLPGAARGGPVVSPGGLHVTFTSPSDGRLALATYGPDGQVRWQREVSPPPLQGIVQHGGPWVIGDRVGAGWFIATLHWGNSGGAPAFDVATGADRGAVASAPIVAARDHRVISSATYFTGPMGQATSATLHDLDTGTSVGLAPQSYTIGTARLYGSGGDVRAWPLSGDPTPLWTGPAGVAGTPVLAPDESAVVVTDADTVAVLDAATGALRWSSPIDGGARMPALAEGTVYVPTVDGRLLAFSLDGCGAPTCSPGWVADVGAGGALPDAQAGQPAVAGGVVYVTWGDGTIAALPAAGCGAPTCEPLWSGSVPAPPLSGPVVSGGRLYLLSQPGTLHAFGPAADP